jgi:hypothetical protein
MPSTQESKNAAPRPVSEMLCRKYLTWFDDVLFEHLVMQRVALSLYTYEMR